MNMPKVISLSAHIIVPGALGAVWDALKIQSDSTDDKLAAEIIELVLSGYHSESTEMAPRSFSATVEHTLRTQRMVADRAAKIVADSEKALLDVRTCARVFRDELIAMPPVSVARKENV